MRKKDMKAEPVLRWCGKAHEGYCYGPEMCDASGKWNREVMPAQAGLAKSKA